MKSIDTMSEQERAIYLEDIARTFALLRALRQKMEQQKNEQEKAKQTCERATDTT